MQPIGIYIHIPFCQSFCPYCDFYKVKADSDLMRKYKEAVVLTTASFSDDLRTPDGGRFPVDTVYFGGGTPSVMPGESIAEMLGAVREYFDVTADAEITVECNPSSDLETFLPAAAQAGVNRVSLGLQSAVDRERRGLGRLADAERVKQAVELTRSAGIDNLSLDVMLGVPGQTEETLTDTLQFITYLGVPHVSAYMLQLEEGTVFWRKKDSLGLPDECKVCDLYNLACSFLEENGILQYEISNFAAKGFESRHNLKYWNGEEYFGIGPAAHSFIHGRRFYFPPDLASFLEKPQTVDDGEGGSLEERLMLGLRLTKGVRTKNLPDGFLLRLQKRPDLLKYLELSGTDSLESGYLRLTRQGFLVSNTVIAELTGLL